VKSSVKNDKVYAHLLLNAVEKAVREGIFSIFALVYNASRKKDILLNGVAHDITTEQQGSTLANHITDRIHFGHFSHRTGFGNLPGIRTAPTAVPFALLPAYKLDNATANGLIGRKSNRKRRQSTSPSCRHLSRGFFGANSL
jgi:hypothetical protein